MGGSSDCVFDLGAEQSLRFGSISGRKLSALGVTKREDGLIGVTEKYVSRVLSRCIFVYLLPFFPVFLENLTTF